MLNSKCVWAIKGLSLYQFYDPIDQAKYHHLAYQICHCQKVITSSFQFVFCNHELLVCGLTVIAT
jgi:hypothetical protein